MVTKRTQELTFAQATSTKDADGYPTMVETSLTIKGRPEPSGRNRRALAPNGTHVEVSWVVYTDNFEDALARGAKVTIDGHEYEVLQVHHYQKHSEIWLG